VAAGKYLQTRTWWTAKRIDSGAELRRLLTRSDWGVIPTYLRGVGHPWRDTTGQPTIWDGEKYFAGADQARSRFFSGHAGEHLGGGGGGGGVKSRLVALHPRRRRPQRLFTQTVDLVAPAREKGRWKSNSSFSPMTCMIFWLPPALAGGLTTCQAISLTRHFKNF